MAAAKFFFCLAFACIFAAIPTQVQGCVFQLLNPVDDLCYTYEFAGIPLEIWTLEDAAEDTYYVTSPCYNVPLNETNCQNSSCPVLVPSPIYQVYQSDLCISCGQLNSTEISPLNANDYSAGLTIVFQSGELCPNNVPRTATYNMVCDMNVATNNGPDSTVVQIGDTYVVNWRTPFACPAFLPSSSCPAPNLPLPTPDQLNYEEMEIGVIIHFNMATAAGTQGCQAPQAPPPVSTFNASYTNFTDQWVASMNDLGAKYAVYVAKHGCGFTTWPTAVQFPEFDFSYDYSVNYSTYRGNIVQDFITSCHNGGVRPGFYYSVVSNAYLRVANGVVDTTQPVGPTQANVTQEQYEDIVIAQLTELWTQNGPLTEIWFDGGYQSDMQDRITALLNATQPQAVIFNGFGVTSNPVRWCGTEAGEVPYPNWSTGETNSGDPSSPYWVPAEVDTTLQNADQWFYNPVVGIRTLQELQDVYHGSVGRNGNLLLDFAPMPSGLLPDNAVAAYKQFGDWVRGCYGTPVSSTQGNGTVLTFSIPSTVEVDRVIIQEDQQYGQRVREYTVSVLVGGEWVVMTTGSSIGNKRIDLFPQAVQGTAMNVSFSQFTAIPIISNFAVFSPC